MKNHENKNNNASKKKRKYLSNDSSPAQKTVSGRKPYRSSAMPTARYEYLDPNAVVKIPRNSKKKSEEVVVTSTVDCDCPCIPSTSFINTDSPGSSSSSSSNYLCRDEDSSSDEDDLQSRRFQRNVASCSIPCEL